MSAGEGWGSDLFDGLSGGDVARWAIALLLVLGGGYALSQGVQHLPTPALTLGEPEPAILIDLAPMEPEAVVPESIEPVAEVPPEPEPEPAPIEELPPEQPPEPVPVTEPPVPEVAEAPAPVEPEVQQPAEPEPQAVPEPLPPEIIPPQDVAEAELPPEEPPLPAEPVEEIVETVPDVPMPVMMSPRLQQQRQNTPALPKPVARQPTPPVRTVASPAPRAQASAPAAASSISPQQWQAQALAQLDRRKVYPRSAQADGIQGTVDISFSVSESGQITGVSIARSSGSSILDQAALETARRASPLPAPPAGYANRAMTAAIRFALR